MSSDLRPYVFHARVSLSASAEQQLISADALSWIDPERAHAALAKYDDTPERRRLRDTVIPLLERRWTDVVFLLPLHPHAIWRAWRDLTGKELPSTEFWAIPVDALPAPTIVLDRTITQVGDPIDPREVILLTPATYRPLTDVTSQNRSWLAAMHARGVKGAWFHGIPHVLTPGPVPVADAKVVDWSVE